MLWMGVRSLHSKFFLSLMPIVLGIALMTIGVFAFLSIERFENQLQEKEKALSAALAQVLGEPLWNYQYETLVQLVSVAMTDPDIVQVRILDEGGNEVLVKGNVADNERIDQRSQRIFYHNAHIEQSAGLLQISFGRQRLRDELLGRVFQELILIVLMSAGFLVCVLLISRYVIHKPLSELLLAMKQSQAKGVLQPVQWRSDDEIGYIIHQYNLMQESLSVKERQLELSRSRYRTLYHSTPALMLSVNMQGKILEVSDYFCKELDFAPDQLLGTSLWRYLDDYGSKSVHQVLEQALLKEEVIRELQACFHLPRGRIDILITAVPQYDELSEYQGHLLVLSDITQLNQAYQLIEHQANVDHLTGLANRNRFQQDIDRYFIEQQYPRLSLLFIDLDGFKLVNDTWGHLVGDQLLVVVAKRMLNVVPPDALVARLGGDEFAILIDDSTLDLTLDELALKLEQLGESILQQMAMPFKISGHALCISASIGIACAPMHATSSVELLQYADIAMYQAKRQGKNAFAFYHETHGSEPPSEQG